MRWWCEFVSSTWWHVPLSFSIVETTFFPLPTWQMAEDGWLWKNSSRLIEETVTMNLQQKGNVIWHKEPVCKSSATAEVFCLPWRGGHPIENNLWQKQSNGHKVWSLQPLPPLAHKSWLSYFTEMVDCGTFTPPCSPQIASLCQRGSVHQSFSQSVFIWWEGYLILQDVSASFSATGEVKWV